MDTARSIRVCGIVQGVGFRPFVVRRAQANGLRGWVANTEQGVEILVEGADANIGHFIDELQTEHPRAASISSTEIEIAPFTGCVQFRIAESSRKARVSACISPDLSICDVCLKELFDSADARRGYPYINCTDCGPRYSIVLRLPYDRPNTTMGPWQMDELCRVEYGDVSNRRFHAQPVACPSCGPGYFLQIENQSVKGSERAIARAAELLSSGRIVAIKGIGGYHLACDAKNANAVRLLRDRKYRKEKPFALMAKSLDQARGLIELDSDAQALLLSPARPIVLGRARVALPEVAPECAELGVMLPYTPLHYLLFDAGSPDVLVMTSANRSSEPIAFEDKQALRTLSGIADAFLVGERPIARRVDDSVVRSGSLGPMILRRARGLAPSAVATLPAGQPILAAGGDLKNAITLVVDGQAFVSQHIGDLDYYECREAFRYTIHDLLSMYEIAADDLIVVHDAHPEYASALLIRELFPQSQPVQHHRAHVASVLAERGCFEKRVLGVSFDGTGFGDDGAIWGGEIFVGSVCAGFSRVAHLRAFDLPGGDAAARRPVQCAAGFLSQLDDLPELAAAPFRFPMQYAIAIDMAKTGVRTFRSSSIGRLFDAAAALLGFTREITFEGQGAAWLESQAQAAPGVAEAYPFPFEKAEFDFRPLLRAVIEDRARGKDVRAIARAFQSGVASGLAQAVKQLCADERLDTVVFSGGVFQNELLLKDVKRLLVSEPLEIWTNRAVPPNDGGISLGQAALAAFQQFNAVQRTFADAIKRTECLSDAGLGREG